MSDLQEGGPHSRMCPGTEAARLSPPYREDPKAASESTHILHLWTLKMFSSVKALERLDLAGGLQNSKTTKLWCPLMKPWEQPETDQVRMAEEIEVSTLPLRLLRLQETAGRTREVLQ